MDNSTALLNVLNNDEESLKLADMVFKSPEFGTQHKEDFLLKWVINNLVNILNEDEWTLNKWLSSEEFKNLTQNDMSNGCIYDIVKVFLAQQQDLGDTNPIYKQQIINCIHLLCDNKVFQQYFRYNLELYYQFLSVALKKIDSSIRFIEFLKSPYLSSKNFLVEKTFYKYFLHILFPILIKKALEFSDNKEVFLEISRVVQKCIFSGNSKRFESFFAQCLEDKKSEKADVFVPKILFKFLTSTYKEPADITALTFKIIFHAASQSFNEFNLNFKFLVVVVQMLDIDITKDFEINLPFKSKDAVGLTKALKVICEILDVLSTRNFTECEVSKIAFTDFLRNLLKSLFSLKTENSLIFQIILKCIKINPLIIEPMASFILLYTFNAYNEKIKDIYEEVVVEIFNVFAKLHRSENFIAKIIPSLKTYLVEGKLNEYLYDVYSFTGKNDGKAIKTIEEPMFSVSNMITESILQSFTNSINGLASWQVINVFKTLLFHLKMAVNEYSDDNKQGTNTLVFLEILGTLLIRLLQSTRVADYNIPQNVVEKLVKGLLELQDILRVFGPEILKREHNHVTMRTFLNISYVWGETYMILTYYSINNEVEMATVIDNTYTTYNLRYLHSYLDVNQWQLISQRITNFGEQPCKKLMQKLYVQKLRAMLLFEENFNNDIIINIIKTVQTQPEDTWKDLLLDKFAIKFIVPKMDRTSLTYLSERLMEDELLHEIHHIRDSITLINATTYIAISKINKLFKHKRKHDQEFKKNLSSKIFSLIPTEIFFTSEDNDVTEIFDNIKTFFDNQGETSPSNIESKEDKVISYLKILKKFPIIYSSVAIQKTVLIYLFSLYGDILGCSQQVKNELENLIIGILQACKFQLTDIFNVESFTIQVLKHFQRYDVIFSLMTDNVFKNENCVKKFEPLVNCLIKNVEDPKYLSCSILVLQAVNKIKKSKMDSSAKEKANHYKEKILSKLAKLVCKSDYLIEAYATCLKHFISMEKDNEPTKKLLDKLAAYIQYSLENINNENKKGCVILFTTVLHNKQKIKYIDENIVLKFWNACKKVEIGDEYSHLVKLIVTLIPNDDFHLLVKDLLDFTETSMSDRNYGLLERQLKTWESILTCDVNPVKMKIWQEVLEQLIQKLLDMLKNCEYDEKLFNNIVHLEESIVQAQRFILSSPLIDMFILSVSILMRSKNGHFETNYNLSINMLEKLLKYRNAMIMDRLPAFLQQYRIVLNSLCARSNSDQSEDSLDVNKASDCAHKLEKLTKNLVFCKKDMSRIAVFLIADFLERYEQINLYPNVKLHLNNCIYSLISLCDHHAISYLMRALSSASTEMFKILYEHYKKYYMFTGKV